MATGQPSKRLIMTWGGGRSEIHKHPIVNNDLSSPELFLLLFRKHLLGDKYQSRLSVEDEITERGLWKPENRKLVESDPGTREDLLNLLSFYTLVIYQYHVFTTRSNKCSSKIYNFFSYAPPKWLWPPIL